jgi:hypothetical protein
MHRIKFYEQQVIFFYDIDMHIKSAYYCVPIAEKFDENYFINCSIAKIFIFNIWDNITTLFI